MVNPLTNAMNLLRDFGYFEVLLPMLLIFAIVYAILMKTGILGESDKSYVKSLNAIIAFVIGFMVVAYAPVVQTLNNLIPTAGLLLVIALLIMMILVFFGVPLGEDMPWSGWLAIPIVVVVLIFLGLLDFAAPFNIPVIHQLVSFFMGGQIILPNISADSINMTIALMLFLIVPIIIIVFVASRSDK